MKPLRLACLVVIVLMTAAAGVLVRRRQHQLTCRCEQYRTGH